MAEDGTSKLSKDQARVPLLTRNIQTQTPVVLIVGEDSLLGLFSTRTR